MNEREKFYVNEQFIKLDYTYNIRCGGIGGTMSPETRKIVSEKLKGKKKSASTKDKMSVSQTGKHLSTETKIRIGQKSIGRVFSKEDKEKMSYKAKNRLNNSIGTKWINNGIITKRIPNNSVIEKGWTEGRIKSLQPCRNLDKCSMGLHQCQ